MPWNVAARLDIRRGLRIHANRVVAIEVAHRKIVQMHVLARRDRPAREADDLVVASHGLTDVDRPRRDLVAGRNQARDGDVLVEQLRAADQLRCAR